MKTKKHKDQGELELQHRNLIVGFIGNLLSFMKKRNVKNDDRYNEIKIGLNMLIEVSTSNGPEEEMSLIMVRLSAIRELIIEYSQDFMTDSKSLREIEKNFEDYFEEDSRIERENQKNLENEENAKKFFQLIRRKNKLLKSDLEFTKQLAEVGRETIRKYK